jgi:hypothetical protein
MKRNVDLIIAALVFSFTFWALPGTTLAQVWSLEKTPARLRPGLCADVRKAIAYDRNTASYKFALKRKQEGTAWRKHKTRLAYSDELQDSYRRLDCRHY